MRWASARVVFSAMALTTAVIASIAVVHGAAVVGKMDLIVRAQGDLGQDRVYKNARRAAAWIM